MSDRPAYRGFYINLDRSTDRRDLIEAEFEKVGLRHFYQRFAAFDGIKAPAGALKPGAYGCFRSHRDLLASQIGADAPVHVLEDDAVISLHFRQMTTGLLATGMLDAVDLVFTDTHVHPMADHLQELKMHYDAAVNAVARGGAIPFAAIDLARRGLACTSSYFVGPRSLAKIVELLDAGLADGPTAPVDLYLRRLVDTGRITAVVLAPFTTTITLAAARAGTINEADNPDSVVMSALLRHAFYIGDDTEAEAMRAAQDILKRTTSNIADKRMDLVSDVLRYFVGSAPTS